jgi:MFS family permease
MSSASMSLPMPQSGFSGLAARAAEQGWLKWAIVITASFAAILEVVDVSIVNVALPYMQGNLGATLSEIGWVSTSYSIANVIVIPLSAWLGLRFGKKRYFIFSLVAFVLASVLCGLASNLTLLIIGRVIQGLGGGGLLAKAQALMFETVPREEQAKASTIFSLGVIGGPAIGFSSSTFRWASWRCSWRRHFYPRMIPMRARRARSTGRAFFISHSVWARFRPCWNKANRTTGFPPPSSSAWRF